ncbi:hypothetical protein [Roseicitreum antarcticum]|uniref:Uncharacterized protein n=1 Tax=Roseicitreum antarcticum TaxID=564137 RepID=A0A1H3E5M1_9RHOB|nr:hypothetical protein [Roseicitreum antarcticum]SDX73996.1 hypothetical protein SAMN04488238_11819 [Roseicitreum antarcticum]
MLKAENFKGEIPRITPRLLPQGFAEVALNAKLKDGNIAALNATVTANTFASTAQSFTFHNAVWRSWNTVVNAVPGPVAQDRLYVTGDLQPRVIVGGETRNLALPGPADAPTATLVGTLDPEVFETIAFVVTFVTDQQEESPPSPISDTLDWTPGLGVTVSNFSPPPAGRGVTHRRIYRSQTSAMGITDLYFVAEQPIAGNSFTYNDTSHPLGEVLPSNDYDAPPSDMAGIIAMPNGMMAAFSGKEVLFCEPFIPHAWPVRYRLKVDYEVVGLSAFGSTLAILTTGQPYLAQGTAPENMVMERVEMNYPCVSARGIVDLGYSAVYPSTEGLIMLSTSGAQVVSRKIWTRDQWAALNPATFIAGQYDGAYVVSHEPVSGTRKIVVIDMSGDQPFITRADIQAAAMHYDISRGDLYILDGVSGGTEVRKWDAGAPMQYRWRSGLMRQGGAVGYGAAETQTMFEAGRTVTTRVFADAAQIRETSDADTPFRLPSGLAERWQFECEGTATVTAYRMAGDISALSGG